jgi:predicted MFS family arabinose efflux permease
MILLLLFVARTSLAFQVQSVASVSSLLVNDLGLDLTDVGGLIRMVMLPGVIIALPSGFVSRWWSDKVFVLSGLAMMMLGGILTGMADSYLLMAIGRLVSGVGLVLNIVYMVKMTMDWFAGGEIATAMSILVTSWPFGFALGQAFQPELAAILGWRVVPYVTVAVCGVCWLLLAMGYQAPGQEREAKPAGRQGTGGLSWPSLGLVSLAGLAWTLMNIGYLIYLSFAPIGMVEHGETAVVAHRFASLASWAMLVSMPAGGWLADKTGKPDVWLLVGAVAGTVSLALLPGAGRPAVLCTAFGLLAVAPAGLVIALPAEVLAPPQRALGMGVFYTYYYAGMATGPMIAGMLSDRFATGNAALYFASALFLGLAVCHWLFRRLQHRQYAAV